MSQFTAQLRRRVDETRRNLQTARDTDDHYLVDVHLGELESLSRLAREHGISLDDPSGGAPALA